MVVESGPAQSVPAMQTFTFVGGPRNGETRSLAVTTKEYRFTNGDGLTHVYTPFGGDRLRYQGAQP